MKVLTNINETDQKQISKKVEEKENNFGNTPSPWEKLSNWRKLLYILRRIFHDPPIKMISSSKISKAGDTCANASDGSPKKSKVFPYIVFPDQIFCPVFTWINS